MRFGGTPSNKSKLLPLDSSLNDSLELFCKESMRKVASVPTVYHDMAEGVLL